MARRSALPLLVLAALLGAPARGEDPAPRVKARLSVQSETVVPGAELELGVVLELAKGWHVYWRQPGESGAPPQVKLELPPDLEQTGPVRWPAPERLVISGGLINHVYEGVAVLLVPVRVKPEARADGAARKVRGKVSWLVCDADICVAGEAALELSLIVVAPGTAPAEPGPDAPALAKAHQALPRAPREGELAVSWEGTKLRLEVPGARELTFFPDAPAEHPPADMSGTHAQGARLELSYPAALAQAPAARITGHLRARVGEGEVHLWVETPGPGATGDRRGR